MQPSVRDIVDKSRSKYTTVRLPGLQQVIDMLVLENARLIDGTGREAIDGVIIVVNGNPCALGVYSLNVDWGASEGEPGMMLSKLIRGGQSSQWIWRELEE